MKFGIKILMCTAIILFFSNSSCKKEGPGGKSTISGRVFYNSNPVEKIGVYVKYDATAFPGDDISTYDVYSTTDASGNFNFGGLVQGDYYIYAKGLDVASNFNVAGGVQVNVAKKKTATININVNP